MMHKPLLLVILGLLVICPGYSQPPGKKQSGPCEVEVTFANGSLVRMVLVPEKLDIQTPYGTLSVPVHDLRRIDFGLHLPDATAAKIKAAIQQLGSTDYKEREAAERQLVAFGAFAYPSLVQEIKHKDLEVAKRVKEALTKIRAKVPAKELQLGDEDKIVTPRFTIVGRVLADTIKAKSEDFGEVELSLAKLRQLRVVMDTRELEVVIDAGKHGQPNRWLDTGILVEQAKFLAIQASGEVELRPSQPGNYVCGPRGYNRSAVIAPGFAAKAKKAPLDGGRAYPGTLLGRIGENGESFVIGDRLDTQVDREGKLYLQIMSSPYDENSTGAYQVKILVRD